MRHLVVGVDGSPAADRALRWAAADARLWDARLTVVHCYPVTAAGGPWIHDEEVAATRTIDDITARAWQELAGVRSKSQLLWAPSGSWAYKLADAAVGSDLLVVGSRGLATFMQLLVGSVSHHVSTHAATSVVVVRGDDHTEAPLGDVIVGVDGSERSVHALRWGAQEAAQRGTELHAVHAYEWLRGTGGDQAADVAASESAARSTARNLLASTVRRAALPSGLVVRQTVAPGAPADVLTSVVRADQVLVCGPRGRSTLGQIVLGSVTRRCLQRAAAPVAVVRGGDEQAA